MIYCKTLKSKDFGAAVTYRLVNVKLGAKMTLLNSHQGSYNLDQILMDLI